MSPRDRIASHLRRILVAAGMALPLPGHADTSTPNPPGKPDDGKTKKPPDGDKKKEPEHLGYEVVDMLPEPYVQPKEFGWLDLKTNAPGILIDGNPPAEAKPPYKLAIGSHSITLNGLDSSENFIVKIKKGKTTVERHDLKPKAKHEKTK